MKKIKSIVIIALVIIVGSPLFAVDYSPTNTVYKQAAEPFVGTSVRMLGMGGAGLGVKGYHDSFLYNPANLVGSGFKFSFTSVTVTAYNPKAILESGAIEEFEQGTNAGMAAGAQKFLSVFEVGPGDVLTTDVSTTITIGSFGIALQAQERLMSYTPPGDLLGTRLIAQVTTAATAGFGFRIPIASSMSIDLGISAQAVYKAYLAEMTASSITTMIGDGSSNFAAEFLDKTPLMAGYSLPISAGINFNFPFGLTISTVAKNINGNYTMSTYNSANDWAEEVLGQRLSEDSDSTPGSSTIEEGWTIEAPWRLDAGLTWKPNIGSLIRPIIAVDVVDVMAMSGKTGDDLTRAFFEQTRLGASVRLLSLFDFRYGLNKGYQSVGVGFDLLVFHIDAAYYTQEYGSNIGEKSIDALSLRFSLFSR